MIRLRVTRDEKRRIERAAIKRHKTVSQYVIDQCLFGKVFKEDRSVE